MSSDNKTALLIDPEAADRLVLARWLRQAGWRVLEAADGAAGLELALERKPALIFCDVHIPGCTGFQICRALRAPPAALPDARFILTTGGDYDVHRETAAKAGADDYFVKPINEEDFQRFLPQIHRAGSVTEILRGAPKKRFRPPETGLSLANRIPSGLTSVRFWGVRGSIPTPGPSTLHYGGNTSCVEVRADGQLIILDAGTGIRELGTSLTREFDKEPLSLSLLISHTHWDHIQGLPFFEPLYNPRNTLRIMGCEGARTGLLSTLSGQMESPYFPVDWKRLPSQIEIKELNEARFNLGAVRVTTMFLNHPGVTLGYRLDTSAGSVVYIPDNEPFQRYKFHSVEPREDGSTEFLEYARRMDQKVVDFAREADVLIMDAQYDATEYQTRAGWGHGCVDDVVAIALNAGVKRLQLFHHDPNHDDDKIGQMTHWAREFVTALGESLEVEGAREGQEIRLERQTAAASEPAAVAA